MSFVLSFAAFITTKHVLQFECLEGNIGGSEHVLVVMMLGEFYGHEPFVGSGEAFVQMASATGSCVARSHLTMSVAGSAAG